jgi:flagella basal body P-ring formation protein FlgA
MRLLSLFALLTYGGITPDTKPPVPPSGPVVTVKVREASDVPNAEFTLGDIAEVTGTDPALVAQVTAVKLGMSPLPGLSRPLISGDITVRLRYNKIDPTRVAVVAPATVRITRAGNEISAQELVQAAMDRLTEERKKMEDGATFEAVQLPTKGFAASGKREYKASYLRGPLETGPVVMQVTTLVDGKPGRTVEIQFRIKRLVKALIASRSLPAHTLLTEADITLGSVDAPTGSAVPLTDLQAVLGKRTTRQILQGALITDTSVELTPVIASGAQVILEVTVGGVTIRTSAVARAAGAVGQSIRVFAEKTKKELTAVVIDEKTVRMEER